MAMQFKVKFEVTKYKPRPNVLAMHLARDGAAKKIVLGVAENIAATARKRMGTGAKAPSKVDYRPLVGTGKGWKALPKSSKRAGTYFSAAPAAIAKEIKVKDATKVFKRSKAIRVALVVGDHPYSMTYERGGYGINATKFFSGAAIAVAGRHTWLFTKHGLK